VIILENAQKFDKKEKILIEKMPVISCKCGEKILVIPNLIIMGDAVKKHVHKHKECSEEDLSQEIIKALCNSTLSR
jgi:hypothetical protein